jgi:hypothetical protein
VPHALLPQLMHIKCCTARRVGSVHSSTAYCRHRPVEGAQLMENLLDVIVQPASRTTGHPAAVVLAAGW